MKAGHLEWLVDILHDAGTFEVAYTLEGSHPIGLTWQSIQAWSSLTDTKLTKGWWSVLRQMSAAYAETLSSANKAYEFEAPFDPGKE